MKLCLLIFVPIAFILINFVKTNNGSKILGIFPTMARSHFIIGSAIMKALAREGHEVTIICPFPKDVPYNNYRVINNMDIWDASKSVMENIVPMRNMNEFQKAKFVLDMGIMITNSTLNDPNVVKFLKSNNETFDLVIMEMFMNEPMVGFSHHFNAPLIAVSTFGASSMTCNMVGSPSPLSYVPNPFINLTDKMNLLGRIMNVLVTGLQNLMNILYYMPKQEKIYKNVFLEPKPELNTLLKKTSLVLLNTHVSLSYPRPYVPNMVEVGGLHIDRKVKSLPDDIKTILDSAKNGVIYFSMGSNLKSTQLPIEKRNEILKAFGSLKEKVLWKWEDENLPGKTDNIIIKPWFPQNEILAHPNVKLFITHGGLLSSTEAIYHGVPLVGIPMFGDQDLNMERAVSAGYGLIVNYNEISADLLKLQINKILSDNKYRENVQKLSAIYRDQPLPPLELAIYWIEYIIKHKGAPHLHSAGLELSFLQYHNIDVFGIIIGSLLLILYLFVKLIKKLGCFRSPQIAAVSEKKKKK